MIDLEDFKIYHYPDGHKHVVSDKDLHGDNVISASLRTFDDLFLLAQVKAIHPELTNLYIDYLLAARCDRRFSPGEAQDLAIVVKFIVSLGFESISIVKPHSWTTQQLFYQAGIEINAIDPTPKLLELCRADIGDSICYIAPDEGARSWTNNYQLKDIINGSKKRDTNGNVVGVQFERETGGLFGSPIKIIDSLQEKLDKGFTNFVIIDDLCDGGATFTTISKEIKGRNPAALVYLVVTHAIFSKGFQPFEGLIDRIYCTNSWGNFEHPLVKQIKI